VKEDEMGETCSAHGEISTYKILVGKPEGKRPLGDGRILKWLLRQ
jgi:hypothetical protein